MSVSLIESIQMQLATEIKTYVALTYPRNAKHAQITQLCIDAIVPKLARALLTTLIDPQLNDFKNMSDPLDFNSLATLILSLNAELETLSSQKIDDSLIKIALRSVFLAYWQNIAEAKKLELFQDAATRPEVEPEQEGSPQASQDDTALHESDAESAPETTDSFLIGGEEENLGQKKLMLDLLSTTYYQPNNPSLGKVIFDLKELQNQLAKKITILGLDLQKQDLSSLRRFFLQRKIRSLTTVQDKIKYALDQIKTYTCSTAYSKLQHKTTLNALKHAYMAFYFNLWRIYNPKKVLGISFGSLLKIPHRYDFNPQGKIMSLLQGIFPINKWLFSSTRDQSISPRITNLWNQAELAITQHTIMTNNDFPLPIQTDPLQILQENLSSSIQTVLKLAVTKGNECYSMAARILFALVHPSISNSKSNFETFLEQGVKMLEEPSVQTTTSLLLAEKTTPTAWIAAITPRLATSPTGSVDSAPKSISDDIPNRDSHHASILDSSGVNTSPEESDGSVSPGSSAH